MDTEQDYGEGSYDNDYGDGVSYGDYGQENMMIGINCDDGLLIPLWPGISDMIKSERVGRGIFYFLVLVFFFLGIAIYLNKLMESMETMTSLMKRVSAPDLENGKTQVIFVKIWNTTLANMFMVLGSFSPVIWITIMEPVSKGFQCGDIAPFTIMGSSAFNLLVVIGVAIVAVPKGQVRRTKNLWALLVLAGWSFGIFIWIYLSLTVTSYGVIESWEALITLIFFILIICHNIAASALVGKLPKNESAIEEYKSNFQLYKMAIQKIASYNPGISDNDLLVMVSECGVERKPNSWAYYVLKATNKIAGREVLESLESSEREATQTTSFDTRYETVTSAEIPMFESEEFKIKVDRILLRANNGGIRGWKMWEQQFKNLTNLQPLGGANAINVIVHILTFPWKLMAAFIPPAAAFGGYVAFAMSSLAILILASLVLDISGSLGCFIGCKDSVTGLILISIGLNIPHLFAVMIAAREEETADLSLLSLLSGIVLTASLGFGLPWFFSSLYWETQGMHFTVPVDSLALSTLKFIGLLITVFAILLGRRAMCWGPTWAGGELGGNQVCKIITTIVFFIFWINFIIFFIQAAYGYINVF